MWSNCLPSVTRQDPAHLFTSRDVVHATYLSESNDVLGLGIGCLDPC